jgi:hypothetical protein
MTLDFQTSNLSKIKPKLRTSGAVSGNFGRAKSKAGSPLRDIGNTNAKVVNVPTQDEYLERLIFAYHKSTDTKLKTFIYQEIRKIKVQRGTWMV